MVRLLRMYFYFYKLVNNSLTFTIVMFIVMLMNYLYSGMRNGLAMLPSQPTLAICT